MAIPKTFEDSFAHVRELATRFKENEAAYLSPKYIEQEVRGQFLDPFFEALGWDVYHREHPNPYEREVKIEKSVMVGDRGKRADYAFFTKPNFLQARFLAEAKKPARNLENQYDCFQAIRYGWNSNTPIAVLTDFEQFIVLDSRSKPNVDRALNLILQKFHYSQFADEEEFRKLYYLFSREAVADGSLEKFVTGLKKGKKAKLDAAAPAVGTVQVEPVGDTFLNELDRERENLARAFKSGKENLDGDELTEITQRTLDRLVFIRFLEDKLVEPSEIIDRFGKKSGNAWRDFANEMPRLNSIYNGIIFKPHAILDSPDFQPDDRRFRLTLNWLSHRNSSYDFNTIPIHILGSIYERFLGKTITVTDKRAKVEEKPEVRKAGGVYYTPEYIVTYIVENTIGKLIAGKTPDEIAEMRFADIACGSGSFLLGMFDYLIKYHVEWFSKPKKRRDDAIKKGLVRETDDGNIQLTLELKRDILLNNIYGVDLDAQAVEVAQLSLYVKLLEEETAASVQPKIGARRKLGGLGEQLLPSLGKNIVHGNSLIDYDIMDGLGFDAFEHRKLYPMSFEQTFPDVFASGGFDAIVGNPPYGAHLDGASQNYLRNRFRTATYQIDSYPVFVERVLQLTRDGAISGYIVPSAWTASKFNEPLRRILVEECDVEEIVVAPKKTFADATVETMMVVFKTGSASQRDITVHRWDTGIRHSYPFSISKVVEFPGYAFLIYSAPTTNDLIKRVRESSIRLGSIAQAVWGVKIYQRGKGIPKQEGWESAKKIFHSTERIRESHLPLVGGSEVERYSISWKGGFVEYGPWLAEPRTPDWFSGPRILVREVTNRGKIQAAFSESESVFSNSVDGVRLLGDTALSIKFLLGVLNSTFASFFNSNTSANAFKDTFPKVLIKDLLDFPVPKVNLDDPNEKAMHDQVVALVEKMIEAKKAVADARTDRDREFYERYCENLDRQIDDLVYKLYDITDEERKIIEGQK